VVTALSPSSTNDRENVNRSVTTGNIRLESTVFPPSTSKPILTRNTTNQGNFEFKLINYLFIYLTISDAEVLFNTIHIRIAITADVYLRWWTTCSDWIL